MEIVDKVIIDGEVTIVNFENKRLLITYNGISNYAYITTRGRIILINNEEWYASEYEYLYGVIQEYIRGDL